jgi:ABC-2 type transport system permease protein
MLRDKRTLALLLIAPLFVLTLMHFIFNGNMVNPKLGTVGVPDTITDYLKDNGVDIKSYNTADKETVKEDGLDALLVLTNNNYTLFLENSDTSIPKILQMKLNQAISMQSQLQKASQGTPVQNIPALKLNVEYVYGDSNTTLFDLISPIMIGLFIFFFVFLISGIVLLRERTTGTLERLMSTPIKRSEVILGYLIGYGFFAIIQTLIIVFFALKILSINSAGSIWYVILINFMCALVALSLGILLSTFATTEFQMMQFIPIVIIPQVFFCGIFPLDGMADWIRALSVVMPLYYVSDALQGVMYKSFGFAEIYKDLIVLAAFAVAFVALNIITLKKYRKL